MQQDEPWITGAVRVRCRVCREGYKVSNLRIDGPSSRTTRFFWDEIEVGIEDVPALARPGPFIVPVGDAGDDDAFREKDLALGNKEVLAELMSAEESADGAVAFTNKSGLLSRFNALSLGQFYRIKRELCQAHKIGRKGGFKQLARNLEGTMFPPRVFGTAEAEIVWPRAAAPQVCWYVKDLTFFLWLELCIDVGGQAKLIQCKRCGRYDARSNMGRKHPDYCSDRCRQAAWRDANKAEVNRARREKRAKEIA